MPEERRLAGVPISLGDALLAAVRLAPRDPAAREAILSALGFEPASPPAPDVRVGPWLDHDHVPARRPPEPPNGEPPTPTPQPADATAPKLSSARAVLRDLGMEGFAVPEWALARADPFPVAAGDADSLPPPPLFPELGSRAILSAVLATWHDGNELDVARTVAALASGRPLRRLPLRQVATLRRGAQVLVDRADAMAPFAHDIEGLVVDLERLLGRAHVQLLQFRNCPGRGVREGVSRRCDWEPPGRRVPLLVVSDFGVGTPLEDEGFADAAEWLRFARRVAEAGCSIVAATPFAPRRWPVALTRVMTFVHWSERTTARQAARALRESSRGAGRTHE